VESLVNVPLVIDLKRSRVVTLVQDKATLSVAPVADTGALVAPYATF
jgi:hypothetical protein